MERKWVSSPTVNSSDSRWTVVTRTLGAVTAATSSPWSQRVTENAAEADMYPPSPLASSQQCDNRTISCFPNTNRMGLPPSYAYRCPKMAADTGASVKRRSISSGSCQRKLDVPSASSSHVPPGRETAVSSCWAL